MSFFIIKKLVCLVTYHHRRENENRCFLPFHGCSVLLRAEWPTPLLAVRGGKGTGNLSAHQVCYPMPEGSYHLISHCLFHHKAPWRGLITCGSRRFGSTTCYRPRGSVSGGSSWHQRLDIYIYGSPKDECTREGGVHLPHDQRNQRSNADAARWRRTETVMSQCLFTREHIDRALTGVEVVQGR